MLNTQITKIVYGEQLILYIGTCLNTKSATTFFYLILAAFSGIKAQNLIRIQIIRTYEYPPTHESINS